MSGPASSSLEDQELARAIELSLGGGGVKKESEKAPPKPVSFVPKAQVVLPSHHVHQGKTWVTIRNATVMEVCGECVGKR